MNDLAREKLVHAALNGQRQIRGAYDDGAGSKCAMGVLGYKWEFDYEWDGASHNLKLDNMYEMAKMAQCEICPDNPIFRREGALIVHLNDVHRLDFLTIARKMP